MYFRMNNSGQSLREIHTVGLFRPNVCISLKLFYWRLQLKFSLCIHQEAWIEASTLFTNLAQENMAGGDLKNNKLGSALIIETRE